MKEVVLRNYDSHGLPVFFRGLSPALMRAFPRHAVVLSIFDLISEKFE